MALVHSQYFQCVLGSRRCNDYKPLTQTSKGLATCWCQSDLCSVSNNSDKLPCRLTEEEGPEKRRRRDALFQLVLAALSSPSIASALTKKQNEEEFSYVEGSDNGPEKWGDLHEEWAVCKNGSLQSPIDILYEKVDIAPDLGKVNKNYKAANAVLKNRGHDISLQWEIGTAGSIQIDGIDYSLEQCHWHSPSEHAINGKRFALELHMVHRNLELEKIAVVAVLYSIGRPDTFLSELKEQIETITDTNDQLNVGVIDPKHIKTGGRNYYRYLGSLTTPPCTEGIIWIVNERLSGFLQVNTVSEEQLMLLKMAVHDGGGSNARPIQSLNNRDIFFYVPLLLPHYNPYESI